MKNPFKKSSIIDTVTNVAIGGAANVAINYAFSSIDMLAKMTSTVKNAVKIAAGAVGGSMVSDKYARAAFDGIATVGASELISGLITKPASGLAYGTIGKVPRRFRVAKSMRGVAGAANGAVISK